MSPIDLSVIELQALKVIRNHVAHSGTFPTVRYIMQQLNYKSPRSASLVLEQLSNMGYIKRNQQGSWILTEKVGIEQNRSETVKIPLIGEIACGLPMLAEQNIECYYDVSREIIKPNNTYFLLRAKGDSMDLEGIEQGYLLLVKSQNTAENGDIVVALLNDEATVKKFFRTDGSIVLQPRSTNKTHMPIILNSDFKIQGIIIKVIPNIID